MKRRSQSPPRSPLGLVLGALALAAIAVAIPYARTPWRIAGLGAGGLALMLLTVPAAPALPIVLTVWATCIGLGLRASRDAGQASAGEH